MSVANPWRNPHGVAAWRPTGEVGPVVGTLAHLGAAFVAGNALAIVSQVGADDLSAAGWVLLAMSVATVAVAEVLARSRSAVPRALYGFTTAVAAGYAGIGAGTIAHAGGSSDQKAMLIASAAAFVVAVATLVNRQAAGTVAASAAALAGLLLSAVAITDDPPRQAYAAALLLVGVLALALAAFGHVRPAAMAVFASVAAGAAASVVLVAEDVDVADGVLCVAILVALGVVLLRQQVPVAVAVLALAAAADISLMAVAADMDTGWALGPAVAGALGAAIAASHDRRAPIRPRLGGTYALCGVLTLAAAPALTDADATGTVLVGSACLVVLLLAAASSRRLVVAAASVIELVAVVPDRFTPGAGGDHLREAGFIVAGVVIVVLAARSRRGRPTPATEVAHGDLPAGDALTATLPAAYPDVFDRVLSTIAATGSIQHVDRAAGRIATTDVAVAVWQLPREAVTHVAVYGDPQQAQSLLEALTAAPAG